jgi:hypothetical protein
LIESHVGQVLWQRRMNATNSTLKLESAQAM